MYKIALLLKCIGNKRQKGYFLKAVFVQEKELSIS